MEFYGRELTSREIIVRPAMAPKPKPPSAAELQANKDFFSKMGFTPAKKVPEDAATAQAARVAADAEKEQADRVAFAGQKLRRAIG